MCTRTPVWLISIDRYLGEIAPIWLARLEYTYRSVLQSDRFKVSKVGKVSKSGGYVCGVAGMFGRRMRLGQKDGLNLG